MDVLKRNGIIVSPEREGEDGRMFYVEIGDDALEAAAEVTRLRKRDATGEVKEFKVRWYRTRFHKKKEIHNTEEDLSTQKEDISTPGANCRIARGVWGGDGVGCWSFAYDRRGKVSSRRRCR